MNFDELERFVFAARRVDVSVDRLDKRRLPHAAGAPQERVVRRKSGSETFRVIDEDVADPLHATDKPDINTVHPADRLQVTGLGRPHETISGSKVGFWRFAWSQPGHRCDQPVELLFERLV